MTPTKAGAWRLLAVGLLSFCTGCGSTVQLSSTSVDPGVGATGDMGGTTGDLAQPNGTSGGSPASGSRPPAVVAGTPARAGSGNVPTSPAAGATSIPRVTIPGVTSTTMTVGVIAADPSTNQAMENAGLGAASVGNEPADWQAMADEINARGGVAGRHLTLVFHLVNLTDSPSVQGQAACEKFTQDTKVALVLSGYYYAPAHRCLSQRGVPVLLGTNYGVDGTLAQQTRNVVAWATPLLDRLAALLPGAFQKVGKLKPGTTAGIFVTDAPAFTRSASRLSADLTRKGLKVVTQTVRDSDSGDYSSAASDASAAVLRFRSAGVTEILFLTHNAFEPSVLMQAANSQSYKPTYLLSTQQYPASLVGLVPPGQLDRALAVGWAPAIDLSSGYDSGAPAQQCLRALKKHGRTFSSGVQTLAGLLACDGIDLLRRAAQRPGALTSREQLTRSALDSSNGFVSAVTFKTSFPEGRRDGVAVYRPMAYAGGCGCFSYTGPLTAM